MYTKKDIPIHWSYLSNLRLSSDWYTHKTLLCNDLPTHDLCGDCVGCFKLNKQKTYNEITKKISKTHPYATECYIWNLPPDEIWWYIQIFHLYQNVPVLHISKTGSLKSYFQQLIPPHNHETRTRLNNVLNIPRMRLSKFK